MALLTGFLAPQMLRIMNTPEEIAGEAASYIRIIFFGIPVTVAYNLAGCVLRSVGDSRTPVIFLVIASLVNIALDLFFIVVLHTGPAGAAAATVISQAAAGAGCIVCMFRHLPMLLEDREGMIPHAAEMKKLFAMGVPMGLQYSVTAVGSIVLQTAVNGLGTSAVAAVTAAGKIYCFFTCVFDALATAMATWCGQHTGAGKLSRIPEGLRAVSMIGVLYCIAVLLLVYFFGGHGIAVFLNTGERAAAAAMAYRYLLTNVSFFIALLFVNLVRFSIQGMGFTRLAVLAGVFEMAARIIMALVFMPFFGFSAACLANPAAWVLADLFLFPCYAHVYRKLTGENRTKKRSLLHGRMLRIKYARFFLKILLDADTSHP